jgi:hypothetical protein
MTDNIDDEIEKIEQLQESTQRSLEELGGVRLQPVSQELIDGALELINNPPPRPEPGDPFYDVDKMFNECLECGRDKRDPDPPPCNYCKPKPNYPDDAPDGAIFVCGACGKTSKSIYGDDTKFGGWDESCMLNAVLCKLDSLVYECKRVVKADAVEGY